MNLKIKEETDKLVKFIETAPIDELNRFLADANFGSLKYITPLINRVLTDPHLYPRKKLSEDKGKPVYGSPFPVEAFYQIGNCVYCDYSTLDGKQKRYKYEYKFYNTSKFCEKNNIPLEERPTTQPFDMLVVSSENRA